jgi:hypothetical protein
LWNRTPARREPRPTSHCVGRLGASVKYPGFPLMRGQDPVHFHFQSQHVR